MPLSLRALAQRFQISHSQVGNLLEDAARPGWFATSRDGRLDHPSDDLLDEFEQWACWQMIHFDGLVAHALVAPRSDP